MTSEVIAPLPYPTGLLAVVCPALPTFELPNHSAERRRVEDPRRMHSVVVGRFAEEAIRCDISRCRKLRPLVSFVNGAVHSCIY